MTTFFLSLYPDTKCNIEKKSPDCIVNDITVIHSLSPIPSHHANKSRGEIKSVASAFKKVPDAFRENHTLLRCDNLHQLRCLVHFVLFRKIATHDLISLRIDFRSVRASGSLIIPASVCQTTALFPHYWSTV